MQIKHGIFAMESWIIISFLVLISPLDRFLIFPIKNA